MTRTHEVEGHELAEVLDLWGRVGAYAVVGTPWTIARTERGWRARRGGRAVGPYRDSAPAVVRYLVKHGRVSSVRP